MNYDSAVRKPYIADPQRTLHLVHSRNWQQKKSRSKPTRVEAQSIRQIRDSAPPSPASAALATPIRRMGQAVLRWMHGKDHSRLKDSIPS